MDDAVEFVGILFGILVFIVVTVLTIGWVVENNTEMNIKNRERMLTECLASPKDTPCVPVNIIKSG